MDCYSRWLEHRLVVVLEPATIAGQLVAALLVVIQLASVDLQLVVAELVIELRRKIRGCHLSWQSRPRGRTPRLLRLIQIKSWRQILRFCRKQSMLVLRGSERNLEILTFELLPSLLGSH